MNLIELQKEIIEWSDRNFPGITDASCSFAGMIEEWGEYCEAVRREDIAGEMKEVGDYVIFALDFARRFGLQVPTMERIEDPFADFPPEKIEVLHGRLAHCYGKMREGIRGGDALRAQANEVFHQILSAIYYLQPHRFEASVLGRWNEVKHRDWIKYPETGMPPVEA